jgi:hypothetical protein
MFAIRVTEEGGSTVAEALLDRRFNPLLKGVDRQRFPIMGILDPYGDTSLNYLQCAQLLEELQRGKAFLESVEVPEATVGELTKLCRLAMAKPHRQLLFIGD